MVIVRLRGGLGNQLFQFAFGRALAEMRNDELYLDQSFLIGKAYYYTQRSFKLQELKNYHHTDKQTLPNFEMLYNAGKAAYIDDTFPKDLIRTLLVNEEIEMILLEGYFQDEIYLLDSADQIKRELNDFLSVYYNSFDISGDLIDEIGEAVCIHVRRGDYLSSTAIDVHGICEESYYEEALKILLPHLTNPHYYLFSDDPGGADQIFSTLLNDKINVSAMIDLSSFEEKDLLELALMSKGKHFILANSSFSWWGSYLSDWPGKIVIAPKKWYKSPAMYQLSEDIALKSWIRI